MLSFDPIYPVFTIFTGTKEDWGKDKEINKSFHRRGMMGAKITNCKVF